MTVQNYIRDGAAIYARSFAIIRAEADLAGLSAVEERVAVRIALPDRSDPDLEALMKKWQAEKSYDPRKDM